MTRPLLISLGCVFLISSVFYQVEAEDELIPTWIKQVAGLWYENKISDSEFINAVSYLADNRVLVLPQVDRLVEENHRLKNDIAYLQSQSYVMSDYKQISVDESDLKINLHTNKKNYEPNDHIMIFGSVSRVVEGHQVGIVISNSKGEIVAIAKITPNIDGSYGFVADGPKFRESGEYEIHVYYGGKAYANSSYNFMYSPAT